MGESAQDLHDCMNRGRVRPRGAISGKFSDPDRALIAGDQVSAVRWSWSVLPAPRTRRIGRSGYSSH